MIEGFDWIQLLVAIAGLLTAAGTGWAIVTAASRLKKSEENKAAENTLDGAFKLIKELQAERDRCDKRIEELEEEKKQDRIRIESLEHRVSGLEKT